MEMRCRLCAEGYGNQIPVLDDVVFTSKIYQLFQLKISIDDRLPTTVCQTCIDTVERIWQFNNQIQNAQEVLTELVNAVLTITADDMNDSSADDTEISLPFEDETCKDEKCDFVIHNVGEYTPESDKEESPVEIKKKLRSSKCKPKKKTKKKRACDEDEGIEDLEYDINSDGSLTLKYEAGWEAYSWTCCDCQNIYQQPDDLREHYATAHNFSPRYLCCDCPKIYSKYSTFIAHVKVHRYKLKYCCDICYKWYQTVEETDKHRSEHGDERPHTCSTCGKRFRMQSALLVHARSHLPAEVKNRYQCDQCPKRFGTKPNLMAHKRIHSGVRDFTCDQCGKSFVQKGNLDNHLLTHTAARPFTCNSCGKSFKTLVRLRKHGSVHSGLKPHKCDICGRQFRERGTLKEHHRIHTGAMPFTCEFCGKCFRFKGVLTTHRRQHTGERPYSCNECQHHFTNWPNYNKHMKRRHGINTSVNCRTRQDIPPTGMPHRNPPGTVLAPPQPVAVIENYVEPPTTFYPVLGLYNIPDDLLQQRV